MTLGIAADVIADMAVHRFVILPRHAFTALATALTVLKKPSGGVFHREFRGIAAKRAGAHLPFGRYPEGVGFLLALELAALAMAVHIHDVDQPADALHAVGVLPGAFADRHDCSSEET